MADRDQSRPRVQPRCPIAQGHRSVAAGDYHELHAQIAQAYELLERRLSERTWAAGSDFTLADCAAAPALYYANRIHPIPAARPRLLAYWEQLKGRPSFARVFEEAAPYLHLFPG